MTAQGSYRRGVHLNDALGSHHSCRVHEVAKGRPELPFGRREEKRGIAPESGRRGGRWLVVVFFFPAPCDFGPFGRAPFKTGD